MQLHRHARLYSMRMRYKDSSPPTCQAQDGFVLSNDNRKTEMAFLLFAPFCNIFD